MSNLIAVQNTGPAKYRILALDGGGIKGAYTASILATWEKETGKRIVDHFDLISGTSTGGIIAIGLGLGLSAQDILEFYQNYGAKIFPNLGLRQKLSLTLQHFFRPKYSHESLRAALTAVFGDRLFGESQSRLVIPTYDAVRGRIFVMKTAHLPRFTLDYKAKAVDVALTTSAAPTFFDPAKFASHANNVYVDGGVWANCPALVALMEAYHFLNQPLDQIDVLSVGTTKEPSALLFQLRNLAIIT